MFGLNNFQLWCLAYITFGSTLYGYDSGITTSVLAYANFLEYFALDANTIGAFNAAYYAASAVGNFLNTYFPNKYGRIATIRWFCYLNVVGVVLQTGAVNYGMLVAGRTIGGICSGVIFSLCPVYASEISPPQIRGRVGMIYAINVALGYMVTEWIGLGLYFISENSNWRVLFGLQLLPTFMMLIGSYFMPRSPRWLVLVGRDDEALEVLQKIHSGPGQSTDFYKVEFHQIKAQIELDKEEKLGLRHILTKPSYRTRLALIVGFFLFQQLTGIIPLQNYQVFIYKVCGFGPVMSLILVGIWGTIAVVAVIIVSPYFDYFGRRKMMFFSYSVIIIGSLFIVIMWAVFEAGGSTNTGLAKGIIFGMFFMLFGYAGVLNTFAPVYSAEISPTCVRTTIVACGYATFNAVVILLVYITPLALQAISWKFFLIFVICDFVFIVLFYFFYPETKNKTLEEIEAVFGDKFAESLEDARVAVAEGKRAGVEEVERVKVGGEKKV